MLCGGDGGWDRDKRSGELRVETDGGVHIHEVQGAACK